MSWEINTYANRFAAGDLAPEEALEAKVEGGVFRVQCPGCGLWPLAFVMVDCRAWPAEFTGGAKFLCDGCWTGFEREGHSTGEAHARPFSKAVMLEWAGAPPEIIARGKAILAARRARFAGSEGARRADRPHASRIGVEMRKAPPGAEIAARIAQRAKARRSGSER